MHVVDRGRLAGLGGGPPNRPPVARAFQSVGFTPAARTRTRISTGPGSGRSTSATLKTSGPPSSSWVTAFMLVITVSSRSVTPSLGKAEPPRKWPDSQ